MRLPRTRIAPALALGALGFGFSGPLSAQTADTPKAKPAPAEDVAQAPKDGADYKSIAELEAAYARQAADLDRRRIADLAALAGKLSGPEADAAYHQVFQDAIARDRYEAAAKAAAAYLADAPEGEKGVEKPKGNEKGKDEPDRGNELRAMATFVDAVHKVNREQYPEALREIDRFLKRQGPGRKIEPNLIYAVGEAFLQRLIRAGRYDVARQACELFIKDESDKAVKSHFASRLARVNLLGKAAPPIEANDVDGSPVSLADLKGKVVLVDFWATWCPPCVAAIPAHRDLYERLGPKGFEILGVNLDAARQGSKDKDAKDAEGTQAAVRHFLVEFGVPWTNVLNGSGKADIAKAYAVTDLPTSFLIDRDGVVVQVEQYGPDLEKAIARALGEGKDDARDKPKAGK